MHRAKKTVLATMLALSASMPVPTLSSAAGTNISCIAQKINNTVDTILNNLCPSTRQPVTSPCAPTPISTPTTITAPGAYCLATAINGHIAIQSDNVTLDLSGRSISNGISITGDHLTVHNGIVAAPGAAAISATNCTALTMQNITAKNSLIGALLSNVQDAHISFCTFSTNTTGLEINASSAIRVHDCSACDNDLAGFSLMNAESNCFQRCTALNNGSGSPTDGFGFVSTNGSANIFQQCTADATQTATTNFCNVAAGFALLGTEQCSKIVECSACNAFGPFEAEPLGSQTQIKSARPHGILLESISTKTLLQVASTSPSGFNDDQIRSINWSGDGKYLAIGGEIQGLTNTKDVFVYQFNPFASNPLTQVASVSPGGSNNDLVLSVDWSPDGTYLAVGGSINGSTTNNDLFVYQFDPMATNPLTLVASVSPGGSNNDLVFSVDWSPDGTYLAVGGSINGSTTNNDLFVYQFDPMATNPLTLVASVSPGGSNNDIILSVNWSPDGVYLAVGGNISGSSSNDDLLVYQFDPSALFSNRLVAIASINPGGGFDSDTINSVDWSPDGKYLAAGGFIQEGNAILVYQFDPSTSFANRLTPIAASNTPGDPMDDIIQSVNWSPDGKYLAVGGRITGTPNKNDIFVYQFDPSALFSNRLNAITSINPGGSNNNFIFSVNWSPDGTYLAVGGTIAGNDLIVYQFKQNFPTKNFIQNNTATCNMITSTQCPRGVGISGSSIQNCIISNTAYNNPFNYTFVTNTFSQLLAGNFSPSRLQNVDLIGCAPLCTPANLADLMNCLFEKNTFNQSLLEQILFKIN